MIHLLADVRFALRLLARQPVLAMTMLLTLALGIGATAAIFSLVYAVLIRPLPYPHPEQLAALWETNPQEGLPRFTVSAADFHDWRERAASFQSLAAVRIRRMNLTGGSDDPEQVSTALVTADLWRLLGARPYLGRLFSPRERATEHLAVLSAGLWRRRFAADPRAVGRALILDGEPYTVVGVAEEGLTFPRGTEVWLQLDTVPNQTRGSHELQVFGRLREGCTLAAARAEIRAVAADLARQFPDTNTGWSADLASLHADAVRNVRESLDIVFAAVACVLLLACLNVANLLVVQVSSRRREIGLRLALGARRSRLTLQILTESLVVAVAGGALGLALAFFARRVLAALAADVLPPGGLATFSPTVLGFSAAVMLGAALICGLPPLLNLSGHPPQEMLRSGAIPPPGTLVRRLRGALVVTEVALALVLVAGAALLVRSLALLGEVDPGFHSADVITFNLALPGSRYRDAAAKRTFVHDLLERLRSLPSVEAASAAFPLPLDGSEYSLSYEAEGQGAAVAREQPTASVSTVSPGYLAALGIRLLSGRDLAPSDGPGSSPVVIVNRTLAQHRWPGRDPLGRRITFDDPLSADALWLTVVGLAADVRRHAIWEQADEQIYRAQAQFPTRLLAIVVRSAGRPQALAPALVRELRTVDRDLPMTRLQPLGDLVTGSLRQRRLTAMLCALFAAQALGLAVLGVYGVASQRVDERMTEAAVRIAVGARPSDLALLIVRQGLGLVLPGVVLGLLLALPACRAAAAFVYRISPYDPWELCGAALALAAAGMAACLLPALRIARLAPVTLLRAP